jgi:hypothetical protein
MLNLFKSKEFIPFAFDIRHSLFDIHFKKEPLKPEP